MEKEGYNDEIGHTWNCVKLDGVWYNCDATAESWIPKKSTSMGAGLFFAFSDQLVAYEQKWSDKYPACEKSYYMNPSGTAKNLKLLHLFLLSFTIKLQLNKKESNT